jgi:hypothetical protein
MIADDLRRQADEFLDLTQLIARVGRDPGERPARPPAGENGRREYAERGNPRNPSNPGLESRYGIRQPGEEDNAEA